MRKNSVSMQVRISRDMHKYITKEAERLAIAKNAVIVQLLDEAVKERQRDQDGNVISP